MSFSQRETELYEYAVKHISDLQISAHPRPDNNVFPNNVVIAAKNHFIKKYITHYMEKKYKRIVFLASGYATVEMFFLSILSNIVDIDEVVFVDSKYGNIISNETDVNDTVQAITKITSNFKIQKIVFYPSIFNVILNDYKENRLQNTCYVSIHFQLMYSPEMLVKRMQGFKQIVTDKTIWKYLAYAPNVKRIRKNFIYFSESPINDLYKNKNIVAIDFSKISSIQCSMCNLQIAHYACGQCKKRAYCTSLCHKRDWPKHRLQCNMEK